MTSINFSHNFELPSVAIVHHEDFLKSYMPLQDQMNSKSEIVTQMLEDYKREIKQFEQLKKLVDSSNCPAFLQSVAYSNLSSSVVSYSPSDLRELGCQYIISTHAKITKMYWSALLDKLNISRIFHTSKAKNIISNCTDERYLAVEEAYGRFNYSEFIRKDSKSQHVAPDFNAKNINDLCKKLLKPLNQVEVKVEIDYLKNQKTTEIIKKNDTYQVTSNNRNITKQIVSLICISKYKGDWLSKFSSEYLTPLIDDKSVVSNLIPDFYIEDFEYLFKP